jgi:hypothetical protein
MTAKTRKGSLLAVVLILLWLAIVFAAYFAFHRPFSPETFFQFIRSLVEIAVTAAITVVAGGVGAKILPKLKAPALARLALRAALGFSVLSIVYFLIGSALGTSAWVAWAFFFILLVVLRGDVLSWVSDFSGFRESWESKDGFVLFIAWLIFALFFFALLTALAPPLKFDSLAYHLTLPRHYIIDGRINFVEGNVYWGFPQLAHTLSTWAIALGARWGALIAWVMGLLCVLGLVGHLGSRVGERPAWVAAASLLCGYSLAASLGWAYVDWPTMLIGWALLFSLDLWSNNGELGFATLSGLFAGFALGAKYTAALLIVLGLLVLATHKRRNWAAVRAYIIAAVLISLPWLLKNLLPTGNPLYPLLFARGEMDAFRVAYVQGFAPQGNWLDVFLLPLRATFYAIEGAVIGDAPGYVSSVGPLLLALGALAVFPDLGLGKDQHGLKKLAAVFALGGLLLWAIAGRFGAYLIPTHLYFSIFPAFAILAAFGYVWLERIKLQNLNLGRMVAALIGFVLALNLIQIGQEFIAKQVPAYLGSQMSEQQYLENNLGMYAVAMQSVQQLPTNARVLLLWESRGYYCVPRCDPDELIDRWPHDLATYGTPDAAIAAWREEGYTHVLHYALGARFIYEDPHHFHAFDLEELETTLSNLELVQDFNGDYLLYSLSE